MDPSLMESPLEYGPCVVHENGRKMSHAEALRAMQGMLVSALLFYSQFKEDLEEIGFEFNPCDPCVANGEVNGKQQTIGFHVDDLMSSHVDSKVNDKFLKWLNEKHGNCGEVTATRGKKHDYLGMDIEFTEKRRSED